MPACSFCKQNYEFPRGMSVVGKDGIKRQYCSSKCRKNAVLGRLPKKVKWITKSDLVKAERKKREASKRVKKA